MSDFTKSADINPQEADKAVQGYYGEMRRSESAEEKQKSLRAMMESQASIVLGQSQPWQWINLVHAASEYVPPNVYGISGSYPELKEDILKHDALVMLERIYPRAAKWYKTDIEKLFSAENVEFDEKGHRTDKDPLRIQWQNFRRGILGDDSSSPNEKHNEIMASPLLEQITNETPWTALDIIQASVEAHPEEGRDLFAQQHFFDSEALKQVKNECPEYAQFLMGKVMGLITIDLSQNPEPEPQP